MTTQKRGAEVVARSAWACALQQQYMQTCLSISGDLKEEIFMEPPPGLKVPDGMVLELVKVVYGTKQGGHVWCKKIRDKLKSMDYTRTESD